MNSTHAQATLVVLASLISGTTASAQFGGTFTITKSVIGGGGNSSAETFVLVGIAGQPDAGDMAGGSFLLKGGFAGLSAAAPPAALLPEPTPTGKDRFLTFVVPPDGAGAETAIRATLVSLYDPSAPFPINPPDFTAREGEVRYVNLLRDDNGAPVTSCLSSPSLSTFYRCATLGCDPEYADWAEIFAGEPIHLSGSAIVPDSIYTVSQLAASCAGNEATCAAASAELQLATARFGDVDDSGLVNVTDVVLTVDVVKAVFGAVWEYQCYIRAQDPKPHLNATNVTDIVLHVDAVKLVAYQLNVPTCP